MPLPIHDEAEDVTPNDNWVAECMHTDGYGETISLSQLVDHRPSHCNDFNPAQKYAVRSSKWNKENKIERFKAYIGRIAGRWH